MRNVLFLPQMVISQQCLLASVLCCVVVVVVNEQMTFVIGISCSVFVFFVFPADLAFEMFGEYVLLLLCFNSYAAENNRNCFVAVVVFFYFRDIHLNAKLCWFVFVLPARCGYAKKLINTKTPIHWRRIKRARGGKYFILCIKISFCSETTALGILFVLRFVENESYCKIENISKTKIPSFTRKTKNSIIKKYSQLIMNGKIKETYPIIVLFRCRSFVQKYCLI